MDSILTSMFPIQRTHKSADDFGMVTMALGLPHESAERARVSGSYATELNLLEEPPPQTKKSVPDVWWSLEIASGERKRRSAALTAPSTYQ